MNQDASKTLSDHSENDGPNEDSHTCMISHAQDLTKKDDQNGIENKSDSVTSNQVCYALKTSIDHLTMAILDKKSWKEKKREMKEQIKVLEKKNALYMTLMRADEKKIKDLQKAQWHFT
jgi:hypothetical protein